MVFRPFLLVVGVAVPGGPVAPRDDAFAVADLDGFAEGGGGPVAAAAEVEWGAVAGSQRTLRQVDVGLAAISRPMAPGMGP
ncbi:hypothetical protein BJF85_12320 [Saccharomonospora sp. CUA-673]|nr:hypothetical protein BJF85_12320 [Saccharomonospora sp. CUA-673]